MPWSFAEQLKIYIKINAFSLFFLQDFSFRLKLNVVLVSIFWKNKDFGSFFLNAQYFGFSFQKIANLRV